jgi:hypothetical protein
VITLHKFVLVAGLMLLAQQSIRGADDSIVIVANSSLSVTAIAPDDLREIFLGTQYSLSNGTKVTAVLLKAGPVHESFLKGYLGKSPEGFRAWWLQMVFTGQRLMPKTFESEADLVNYVARNRGAIGYATRASVRGNVKCVAVTDSRSGTP